MFTVKHKSSRSSTQFYDSYFDITGVPTNNHNTIVISEALNDKLSKYGDEAFSPKPNDSSYTIFVRSYLSDEIFKDKAALEAYILERLISSSSKFMD